MEIVELRRKRKKPNTCCFIRRGMSPYCKYRRRQVGLNTQGKCTAVLKFQKIRIEKEVQVAREM